jgi:hypothetical protein
LLRQLAQKILYLCSLFFQEAGLRCALLDWSFLYAAHDIVCWLGEVELFERYGVIFIEVLAELHEF